MLIRLLRFWRGTLEFQVSGKYLERFLNLAARAKIPIWDGCRADKTFRGKTLSSHEEELKSIAEKVQLSWDEEHYSGTPKLKKNFSRRYGIVIGILLIIGGFLLSQQFVWSIAVTGNDELSSQKIVETARQFGLRNGVWKHKLDVIQIADNISLEFEEVSWAAVNLRGTVAEIEIVERVMPPDIVEEEGLCNVIAGKAGQLVELEVYDGKKMVKVGETVTQGQLLASGILTDRHGRTMYRHARAKAIVEYTATEIFEIPLRKEEPVVCGSPENSWRICLGNLSFPLTYNSAPNHKGFSTESGLVESGLFRSENGEQWFYSVRNFPLEVLGASLPAIFQLQQYIPAQTAEIRHTEEQAKELSLLKLEQYIKNLEKQDITICGKELTGKLKNGCFILTADLVCREDVALENEIYIQNEEISR